MAAVAAANKSIAVDTLMALSQVANIILAAAIAINFAILTEMVAMAKQFTVTQRVVATVMVVQAPRLC